MRTVLLVADSDPRQLEHTHSYFATIGFHIERARNGVECLTILNRVTPHAVLLDANMAWGGAEGVLEVMNGDFALRSLPVVMIESGRAATPRPCECRPVVARLPRPLNLLKTLMILLEELPEFAREMFLAELDRLAESGEPCRHAAAPEDATWRKPRISAVSTPSRMFPMRSDSLFQPEFDGSNSRTSPSRAVSGPTAGSLKSHPRTSNG
jgi:hypothetical protein